MTLNFTKNEDVWVAEFTATTDFNLHIEGVIEGNVRVYQRGSASGDYALVRGAMIYPSYGNVYDMDFTAAVYPKYMKVVCETEPAMAVVTFAQ